LGGLQRLGSRFQLLEGPLRIVVVSHAGVV
jgi:hypothetical protein